MVDSDKGGTFGPGQPIRDVPVDWEALEDAFENNAPEVHSYFHFLDLSLPPPDGIIRQTVTDVSKVPHAEIQVRELLSLASCDTRHMEFISVLWLYLPVTSCCCLHTHRTTHQQENPI